MQRGALTILRVEWRAEWLAMFAFAATLLAVFVLYPLLFLLFVCVVSAAAPDARFKLPLAIAAVLLFSLLNLSKAVEGDLLTYVNLQQYIAHRPFLTLFNEQELQPISASYRATELGFYVPLWALAAIFPNGQVAISIAATLAIYVTTIIGLLIIQRAQGWSDGVTLVVFAFVLFAAINFVQTSHLVRQYISASFGFLAFAFFLRNRAVLAALCTLMAISIHNGTVVVVGNLVAACLLFPYEKMSALGASARLWRGACLVAILGLSGAALAFHEIVHFGEPAQNIAPMHYAAAASLFFVYRLCSRGHVDQARFRHYVSLAFSVIFILSVGFFVVGFGTLAVRYFVYLEWLFGLLAAGTLFAIPTVHLGLSLLSRWLVLTVATLVFFLRIHTGSWTYGAGDSSLFNANLMGVVSFVAR